MSIFLTASSAHLLALSASLAELDRRNPKDRPSREIFQMVVRILDAHVRDDQGEKVAQKTLEIHETILTNNYQRFVRDPQLLEKVVGHLRNQ